MEVLTIKFLPNHTHGSSAYAEEEAQKVPILATIEQRDGTREVSCEAFGFCVLPTPTAVRILAHLLDSTQASNAYLTLLREAPPAEQAVYAAMGLPTAMVSMHNAQPDPAQWREPVRFIGENLFMRLCSATDDRGMPKIAQLINTFLQNHQNPATQAPTGCMIINVAQLAPSNAWRAAILALPWEALFEPNHPLPIQIEHGIAIVRSVAPYTIEPLPILPTDKPVATFTILPQHGMTAPLQQAEAHARPYHPVAHADFPVWCDCAPPQPTFNTDSFTQLKAIQLLHFFGHGFQQLAGGTQPVQGLGVAAGASVATDDTEAILAAHSADSISALLFCTHLKALPLWLFSCFACYSGSGGHTRGEPLTSIDWTLVNALGEHIPALLMMTVRIAGQSAGVAGAAWYQALAQGNSILHAAWAMRQHLWTYAQQHTNDGAYHAWWVPALYLRTPNCANQTFVDHQQRTRLLVPDAPPTDLPTEHQQLLQTIVQKFQVASAVILFGREATARTMMLAQLQKHLTAQGETVLYLSAKPNADQTDQERAALLRREIVCKLEQAAHKHVHWSAIHERTKDDGKTYEEALRLYDGNPLYILVDAVNQADAIQGLFIKSTLIRFVAASTTPEARNLLQDKLYTPEVIEIKTPLADKKPPRYEEMLTTVYKLSERNPTLRFITELLLTLGMPLHQTSVIEIARFCVKDTALHTVKDTIKELFNQSIIRLAEDTEIIELSDLTYHHTWFNDTTKRDERNEQYKQVNSWLATLDWQEGHRVGKAILCDDALAMLMYADNWKYFVPCAGEAQQHYFLRHFQSSNEILQPYKQWRDVAAYAASHGYGAQMQTYILKRITLPELNYTESDKLMLHIIAAYYAKAENLNELRGRYLQDFIGSAEQLEAALDSEEKVLWQKAKESWAIQILQLINQLRYK